MTSVTAHPKEMVIGATILTDFAVTENAQFVDDMKVGFILSVTFHIPYSRVVLPASSLDGMRTPWRLGSCLRVANAQFIQFEAAVVYMWPALMRRRSFAFRRG